MITAYRRFVRARKDEALMSWELEALVETLLPALQ
jgi:hypothetical protein